MALGQCGSESGTWEMVFKEVAVISCASHSRAESVLCLGPASAFQARSFERGPGRESQAPGCRPHQGSSLGGVTHVREDAAESHCCCPCAGTGVPRVRTCPALPPALCSALHAGELSSEILTPYLLISSFIIQQGCCMLPAPP